MSDIKKKIQKIKLFSDAQKVSLLSDLENLPEHDIAVLSETIDIYDREYDRLVTKLKDELSQELDILKAHSSQESNQTMQDAITRIQLGMTLLTAN